MKKRKILGCSDYLDLSTSFARQSALVMEMMKDHEWTYSALCYRGPVLDVKGDERLPGYKLYPNFDQDIHFSDILQQATHDTNPDAVWIYEDAQHIGRYKTLETRAPIIGYFAWDTDLYGTVLDDAMKNVDVPVCMSDFAEKMLNDHGYDVDKVYNCVDEHTFGPCKEDAILDIRRMLDIQKDKKVVLYVGMLHARKNPESLLAMARELKNIRGSDFVLVIHGNPKYYHNPCDIGVEVSTRGISDVVKFTPIPEAQWSQGIHPGRLNAMYNLADVFVSAHGGEGFGIPACEAGLCGKPFVMTDCTTTAEFSNGGRNGIAIPVLGHRMADQVPRPMPDHVKMALEVSALLDDEPKRKVMGKRFQEQVLAKYTMAALKPRWEAVFNKCFANMVEMKEI